MSKQKPEQYQDMLSRLFPNEFKIGDDNKRRLVKTLTFQVTDACNLKCHYCVTGDTNIICSDMTNIPIKYISEGMQVLAYNPTRDNVDIFKRDNTFFTKVTNVMNRTDKIYRITFNDNSHIDITGDHPIRIFKKNTDFMSINDGLSIGDMAYGIKTNLPNVESIRENKDTYALGYLMAYNDFTESFFKVTKLKKSNLNEDCDNIDDGEVECLISVLNMLESFMRISMFGYKNEIVVFTNKKEISKYVTPEVREDVNFSIGYIDACRWIYKCELSKFSNTIFHNVPLEITYNLDFHFNIINSEYGGSSSFAESLPYVGLFKKNKFINYFNFTAFQTTRIKNNFYREIVNIEPMGEETVYNLETESHTYFANNIAVHNCYQINKGTRVMDFEIAKKTIDLVLEDDNPKNHYFSSETSPGIILEFIGGEPLLQIELIDKICNYFYQRCIELRHKWINRFRISMCSNGVLYFDEAVQNFMKKWKNQLSFSITIDGNKELHDSCRVFENGEGSYDIAVKAATHYSENYGYMGSKLTIAPENIKHLGRAIIHMTKLGYTEINANCVYEEGWDDETASEFMFQLIKIVHYWKSNDLFDTHYISLFDRHIGKPMTEEDNSNWCGGTGYMLAVDPDGKFFPCIRYMESSLGTDVEPIVIGNINNGIGVNEEELNTISCLDCITRRSQSTDECFYCEVASGCAWCSAYNYQSTGSVNKRSTNICLMHKIRCYVNTIFWNINDNTHISPYVDDDVNRILKKYDEILKSNPSIKYTYEFKK